jgi:hypothetical protein
MRIGAVLKIVLGAGVHHQRISKGRLRGRHPGSHHQHACRRAVGSRKPGRDADTLAHQGSPGDGNSKIEEDADLELLDHIGGQVIEPKSRGVAAKLRAKAFLAARAHVGFSLELISPLTSIG